MGKGGGGTINLKSCEFIIVGGPMFMEFMGRPYPKIYIPMYILI
jgi:hypothetical protein